MSGGYYASTTTIAGIATTDSLTAMIWRFYLVEELSLIVFSMEE